MNTPREILDSSRFWFLESLRYTQETLELSIAEGILSEPHQIEVLGVDAGKGHSIEVQPFSRRLAIRFSNVFAYQVYEESLSHPEKYEPKGHGILREYRRSEYLEYLTSATSLSALRTSYRHFGVILEDDIVDVVADREPELFEVSEPLLEADA